MKKSVTEDITAGYAFAGYRLDSGKRLLFGPDGAPVSVVPKAFDILLYLVANSDRVVDKDELMSAIWPDTVVEENNLTQNVSSLRKALGERHRENRFIATIPGRGYKFVAAVERLNSFESSRSAAGAAGGVAAQAVARPETRDRTFKYAGVLLAVIALSIAAFTWWPAPASAPAGGISSVAVLPFKPIALDKRDESLEMGMADTLIVKLSGVDTLTVRPLAAVRRFAAPDQDALAAGRELGVDAVLDGRLQIADDRVRATIQFVRVRDGHQLWSGQFDERLTDIFTLQDSIAQRVATQLRVNLGDRGTKRYTESVEAYQLYMRGNLHARRLIRPEVEKGLEYYQKAIEADPQFALALVEIANANRALVLTSDAPPAEFMPKAKTAAVRAVELDADLSEAWTALASSEFWYEWDWRLAEEHFLRGIDLDPTSGPARAFYAHLLSNLGRHDEAVREIKRARQLDPASLITNAIEGQILFFAGNSPAAQEILVRTNELDQRFWLGHLFLTRVYLKGGGWEKAVASARKAAELSGGNAEALATVGYSLAMSGRPAEARQILSQLEDRSNERYVPRYALAQIRLALGDREQAIEHLRTALDGREALMTFLKVEPRWDPLRDDPRFNEILQRMNF